MYGQGPYRGQPRGRSTGHHSRGGGNHRSTSHFSGNQYGGYGRGTFRGRPHYGGRGISFNQRQPHAIPCSFGINDYATPGIAHQESSQWGTRGHHGFRRGSRGCNRSKLKQNWRQKGRQEHAPEKHHSKSPEQFLDFPFLVKPDVVRLMKDFKVMFILRGVPGSGKSTLATAILQKYNDHAIICSADSFRYNEQGEYVWSKEILQETHSECQTQAETFCGFEKPVVIIDNTNVTYPEVRPYIQIARRAGYVVVLIEPKTPWKLHARELLRRNTHNVSLKKLTERLERFEDINPLYFGWFMSPKHSSQIRKSAIDTLKHCLGITKFKQCMAQLSGQSTSKYSVKDMIYFYCMTESPQNQFHVTSCFSPRKRYLAYSPYSKCREVQDSLGHISWIPIIGYVITENTLTARVALTKQQQKLWKNEDKMHNEGGPKDKDFDESTNMEDTGDGHSFINLLAKLNIEDKDTFTQSSLKGHAAKGGEVEIQLKPNYGPSATSHITLGKQSSTNPVQAKHDLQTVVHFELGHYPYKVYSLDDGVFKDYGDNIWVLYLNKAINVPAIFSGFYQ